MKRKAVVTFILLFFLAPITLAGCLTTGPEEMKVILYDEWPVDGYPSDAAEISQVSIKGNHLTLNVTYQGGCRQHDFELYAWSAFLESLPPQGTLYLSHDAHGENCTEEISQSLTFNLSPLDQERNIAIDHPLILRIYTPLGGSFSKEPVIPLVEWP